MDYKELIDLFNKPENIKQQIMNDELFTDEEIINICEEYNKNKKWYSPTKVNTKQIIKQYHRKVEQVKKSLELGGDGTLSYNDIKTIKQNEKENIKKEKELNELLEATGLTLEEFNNLTPLEKGQLKMQFEQNKHIKNMSAMQAASNIANGMDRIR